MDWRAAFSREHQPQPAEMEAFINSPHWQALRSYIEDTYKIQPLYDYSTCSMQEGWASDIAKACVPFVPCIPWKDILCVWSASDIKSWQRRKN